MTYIALPLEASVQIKNCPNTLLLLERHSIKIFIALGVRKVSIPLSDESSHILKIDMLETFKVCVISTY